MRDINSILVLCFYIYVVLTIIFLLLDNRDTSTTFAWIFVFSIFPVFGQILYFLIGRNWRNPDKKKRLIHKQVADKIAALLEPLLRQQDSYTKELDQTNDLVNKHRLLQLLYNNSNSILTVHNKLAIIQSGEEKFELLLRDIEQACQSIHMEYFIWRSDKLTKRIGDALIKKVKKGIKVRILYDALGSIFLSRRYIRNLRDAGVEIYPYYDFKSPFTAHTLNYRNHRKIIIIDGVIGYTGGMNMGKEYVDGGRKFKSWRDTHMRLEGEAAAVLQSIFIKSWLNTTKEDLFEPAYFPIVQNEQWNVPIQITTSGPDSAWESIQQLYFSLIASAEKSVYIQSPYFVPDNTILLALKTAALSGLDVKIMMTGVPDKCLPYWSAYTFFKDLLKAGVKIYQYKKGFLHSKAISVDGEICSIGTANMDMRSFHINYEISTLIYDKKKTLELTAQFKKDLQGCKEITLESYAQLGELRKLRNSVARLFAPLL